MHTPHASHGGALFGAHANSGALLTPFPHSSAAFATPVHFASSPTAPHAAATTATAAAANPLSLAACHFGSGMFPAAHSAVGHFPTAVASLAQAGLSRSAHILMEMSLTFHSAGLAAAAAAGSSATFAPYKPSATEINAMPPPAALALFGQCCMLQGEHRRAIQYTKTALVELAKLRRTPQFAHPAGTALGCLASPELEWTLQLIDAHAEVREEAQAQKLLEQLYTALLAAPPASVSGMPTPALPAKYLLMLARLYSTPPAPISAQVQQPATTHNPRAAIAIHTRLLQQYPLAIESALELIRLNCDPRPIVAAAWAAASGGSADASLQQQSLLLHVFLSAHWNAHQQRYAESLSESGGFNFLISVAPRSTYLLEQKAWALAHFTDGDPAMRTLAHLHAIDPYALGGMELLAMLYHKRNMNKEIATLMAHSMRVDDSRSESWQIAALHSDSNGHKDKCVKYLEKALLLSAALPSQFARPLPSAMALSMPHTLRGNHFLSSESAAFHATMAANNAAVARGEAPAVVAASPALEQCLQSFRRAQSAAPHSALALEGLSQGYLLHALIGMQQAHNAGNTLSAHNSYKNALGILAAHVATPVHKGNARMLAAYGAMLAAAPEGRQKAAKVLHKATSIDPDNADAVLALSDMYLASKQFTDALNMLEPYARKAALMQQQGAASSGSAGATPPAVLLGQRDLFLVKIGQIHVMQGDLAKGLQCYKQALALNPTCAAALEAMQNIDRDSRGDRRARTRG